MTNPLQKHSEALRDAVFAAMTPQQRALLDNGHQVTVCIGDTKYFVSRAGTEPSAEIPVRFG